MRGKGTNKKEREKVAYIHEVAIVVGIRRSEGTGIEAMMYL